MTDPTDHPLRYALTDEFHARPFAELVAPEQISHFALLSPPDRVETRRAPLLELCERYGVAAPSADATHFMEDFGDFRLKWEQHSEFTTYTFIRRGSGPGPFSDPASGHVPKDWLDALPGERLIAAHVSLAPADGALGDGREPAGAFVGESLCCSLMLEETAEVWTDFRIHGDGFTRILIREHGLAPRAAGRLVQRLLEMQTYRYMALLALPLARQTHPIITRVDRSLADLTGEMTEAKSSGDEHGLLDRLTTLSAEIEENIAATSYRFSAARAYYFLVRERIGEMRESSVTDYPKLGAFLERRLAPAMRTCESVAERQQGLSERATRAANLLRTRVNIALEAQNRDLLASMDRRARLQLRLQQTVEGLSVAAITYYVVSLIGYGLKALDKGGLAINVELVRGLSIPVVALLVWLGARWVRKSLHDDD